MVGRPREFDIEVVLDAATEEFWSRGYEATSMSDLTSAMGIQKGSLYKAFESKRGLFMATLDRYLDAGVARLRELADSEPSPLAGLRALLEAIAAKSCSEEAHKGCFAVNTLVELAPHDPEAAARLAEHKAAVTRLFAELIRAAQGAGEVPDSLDADTVARFFLVLVFGIGVVGKTSISPAEARSLVETALRVLQ